MQCCGSPGQQKPFRRRFAFKPLLKHQLNMPVVIIIRFVLAMLFVAISIAGPQSRNSCSSTGNKRTTPIPGSYTKGRCLPSHTAVQPQATDKPSGLCFERISDIRETRCKR